ncbi:MAG: hypothetical protein B7Y13_03605 [Sulfurovum sp. 24-42-9]|nr:MAG: hypothetical protein B7Y13_03605 [Sulfurovum sp. 24-42-9]
MKSSTNMNKYDCDLNLDDRNSLSVLIQQVKPNSTVLEFGPANGRMTKYIKEQLNCKVYAVEIDESAAKDAAPYTERIIIDSIENYSWQKEFEGIKFDYIVFADVLEHLYYPEKVLSSVKDFLKTDGSILISIPNIAHNAIIINLLKDEFNYSPTGLLDDTHIRFFTKKTFDQLIEKAGLFRAFETAIFKNPENTEFCNSYDELPLEISSYLQESNHGEIYQLIYEVKKTPCEVVSDFSEQYKIGYKNFIQLFLDDGNGFTETNSIRLPVAQNSEIQEFTFDLSNKSTLTNLRLDPLDDSCVIEIESLRLIKTDGVEIELREQLTSNAIIHHGESYFFDTIDPINYFSSVDFKDAQKLIAHIRYAHIGRDALEVCIKQTKGELDQTKGELDQTKSSLSWRVTKPLRKIKKILKGN